MDGELQLIERWAEGIEIIACARCHGFGVIGLRSLESPCPRCGGSGRTTINLSPEGRVPDEAEPTGSRETGD